MFQTLHFRHSVIPDETEREKEMQNAEKNE